MKLETEDFALKHHWMHTGRDVGSRPYPIPSGDAFLKTNVAIPTQDGITLRGDLYIPGGAAPFPAIFEATPYGAQSLARYGVLYATRGYLFLAVDCRGRYRSEGTWEPLKSDQVDGHSVIRWLRDHELCNQYIGSRGHSYSGYNQLLTAVDAPPELKALAVGVAPGDPFVNTPYQGGCYDLNDLFWLLDMTGRVTSDTDEADDPDDDDMEDSDDDESDEDTPEEQEQDALLNAALMSRPFATLDIRLGVFHETFREWIRHWQYDEYWQDRSILPHVSQIKVAALHISGWWDGNGRGATLYYQVLRQHAGSEYARENQKLLMGAYDHDLKAPDCDDLPETEATKIERAAQRDCLNDEMIWFDEQLKGQAQSPSSLARVTLFISGINRWTNQMDWPPPDAHVQTWYLDGTASQPSLTTSEPSQTRILTYKYDPQTPTPFGHEDADAERMPFDNSVLQKQRRDLICFDSKNFSTAGGFVGDVKASIFASSKDLADFDIAVSIYDVYPDGRSIFLTDGIRRARFIKSYSQPEILTKGKIGLFDIDLWHLGHVFRPGHKLRLQISSAAYLRFDVNPGTGGDLATETNYQHGTVNIHTGSIYPSALLLFRIELAALFPDDTADQLNFS